eukprot:SAG31_NODE_8883_length_1368_cov_1.003940_2_plen_63_part_00
MCDYFGRLQKGISRQEEEMIQRRAHGGFVSTQVLVQSADPRSPYQNLIYHTIYGNTREGYFR